MFLKHLWNKNFAYIPCIFLRTRLCWLNLAGHSVICILFLDFVHFTIEPLQTSSLTKLSKHLQATGTQSVHIDGDLIVHMRSFAIRDARPFSSFFFKTLKISPSVDVRAAFLVAFYYFTMHSASETISAEFTKLYEFTKNTNATLRAQVTWASNCKIWLSIFNACFTQITSSKIERSFGFDWFFFFSVSSISFV